MRSASMPEATATGWSQKTRPTTAASRRTRRSTSGSASMRAASKPWIVSGMADVAAPYRLDRHRSLLPRQGSHLDEPADDLLDEERIAFGSLEDLVLDRSAPDRSPGGGPPGDSRLWPRSRGRSDTVRDSLLPAAKPRVRLGELRPGRRDEEHRPGRAREQPLDHLDDLVARPVQVLDDRSTVGWRAGERREEQRPSAGELGDDRDRTAPVERVVAAGRCRPSWPAQTRGASHRCPVRRRRGVRWRDRRSFSWPRRRRCRRARSRSGPDDLGEGPVGDPLADRRAAAAKDGEIGPAPSREHHASRTRRLLPMPAGP